MSATLDTDIVFLSGYPCPGCRAELELPRRRPDSWLRCPNCGRPSLPPTMANTPTDAEVWGRPAAEAIAGKGPSVMATVLLRTGLVLAPLALIAALAVDLYVRIVGLDEEFRMMADTVAVLAFAFLLLIGIRAMSRA